MRIFFLVTALVIFGWFAYSRHGSTTFTPSSPSAALPREDGIGASRVATPRQFSSGAMQVASGATDSKGAQPKLVEVPLSETERLNLIAAHQVFLNAKPSSALAYAMTYGRVDRVRADRVEGGESTAVQGWIYYPEVAGYRPMVLCVSETFPVLDWMHCQEHNEMLGIIGSPEQ